MISADLVRARRRGDQLTITDLSASDRQQALAMAEHLHEVLHRGLRSSMDELQGELDEFEREPRLEKVFLALKKLALDFCEFGAPEGIDPPTLRRRLFELASARRRELEGTSEFPRDELVERVAEENGVSPEVIEDSLFSDLKGAAKLVAIAPWTPGELVERYELAHVQAVLLRAVRLTIDIACKDASVYRRLFAKLKFRRLLHRLRKNDEGGYQIVIEGPFSLFESVTKYGVQFALIWPALLDCDRGQLVAELRWGKERRELRFERSWERSPRELTSGDLVRDDVAALQAQIRKSTKQWKCQSSDALFDIPGVGLVVPDLRLVCGQDEVFVEVLGYWSRDAVWRRVEWAEASQAQRTVNGNVGPSRGTPKVIFAASSRLRVSEAVLDESVSASLYVYKGKMSARAVIERAERLVESRA